MLVAMFDSLKKRLKEAVEKVSKSVTKDVEKQRPVVEEDKTKIVEVDEILDKRDEEEKPSEEQKAETAEQPEDIEELIEELEEKPTGKDKDGKKRAVEVIEVDELLEGIEEDKEEKPTLSIEQETKEEIAKARAESLLEEKEKEEEEFAQEKEEILEEEKPKKGFLSRILEKTMTDDDVNGIMQELELALLENDVAVEVAEKIGHDVKASLVNKSVKRGRVEYAIKGALRGAMLDVMQKEKIDLEKMIEEKEGPFTIIFLGFNGVGKTTNLSKLASKLKKYNPVVAAGDTFRAASIEQLEEHSRRAGFRLVKHKYGADAAAVIFDAKKAAEAAGSKLVLADTAGRSHSNINLMDELKKVVRVAKPDLKVLVLDALTGNDIYDQCRLFNDAVGIDAIILTKADVYDKGGAALSAAYTINKPILYLGVGQEYGDLKEFDPEEVVDSLLK